MSSLYQIYFWTLTSCVLVIAASLSKETGVTVLAVLLFIECIQPRSRQKNTPSSFINSAAISSVRVCFVVCTGVFYALLRKVIQGEASLRQWSMMENHIQMAKVSQHVPTYFIMHGNSQHTMTTQHVQLTTHIILCIIFPEHFQGL